MFGSGGHLSAFSFQLSASGGEAPRTKQSNSSRGAATGPRRRGTQMALRCTCETRPEKNTRPQRHRKQTAKPLGAAVTADATRDRPMIAMTVFIVSVIRRIVCFQHRPERTEMTL